MSARQMFFAAAVLLAASAARADMPGCDVADGSDSFGTNGACCDTHDKCYADNGCDSNSWTHDEGPACTQCNIDARNCFGSYTAGPSICTLVPGNGLLGTICQDPSWDCGWYCWSWKVQPSFGSCKGVCTSACGQWDGCSSTCPLYGYGWDCDSCFGCTNCGDCTCGGRCQAPFQCDPNTNNCTCTASCDHPWCGQKDSCGVNSCPNSDDTCTGAGGYTNACGTWCPPVCSSYDCAGICNGTTPVDCAGTCGGSATVDACGVCGGNGSECACTYDCFGVCNGGATYDACGVCGGDGSECACTYDCAGVCNGSATYDACGVCGGDGSECGGGGGGGGGDCSDNPDYCDG